MTPRKGFMTPRLVYSENSLNGVDIPIYAEKDPGKLPWK
ncbi:hypothetical protein HMPREF9412_1471 [Paenibacillus sp. HGF5]|nr:hypothetical protein HMPREF9412_1471 [Paenibacillus sp. HGF5]